MIKKMEKIVSPDNKKIKLINSLKKSGKRKKEDLFLIEGEKEISLAGRAGIDIIEIYYAPGFGRTCGFKQKIIEVSDEIFKRMAFRENPDGFLALARHKQKELDGLVLKKNPLLLILEAVEKPGNIGAMLRTADAIGADALILCDPSTDFFNPNVIRASLGTVFTVQNAIGSNEAVLTFLLKNKINIYSASLEASVDYLSIDYTGPTAIVIGTEHDGLSDFWLKNSQANIKIPMKGEIDSLNASVSSAVILFEAARQRRSK
jgi:RNA methyltransferase, TrmH family